MRLHRAAIDDPALRTLRVTQITDEPVHRNADADADAHTPDDPRPTAQPQQDCCDRRLLQHPGPLQEDIEAIIGDAGPRIESGRMAQ